MKNNNYSIEKNGTLKVALLLAFIVIISFNSFAQIDVNDNFSRTYNIYRTWTKGETPGEYNRLKWQVRFTFSQNSIKKYWEKDGFPSTKFVLSNEYEIVKSKKMDSEVYGYETSNKMMIVCNTGSSNQIMIQEGNKITEYVYASSSN